MQSSNCKVFIGGLSYSTTNESLSSYFRAFGPVKEAMVMRGADGQSRGFGFCIFQSSRVCQNVLRIKNHIIDNRRVDVRCALSKDEAPPPQASKDIKHNFIIDDGATKLNINKIFVGGLHYQTTPDDLISYFSTFGEVETGNVVYNHENHKSRGFGFIIFKDIQSVKKVMSITNHMIMGRKVEVKRAVPKEPEESKEKQPLITKPENNSQSILASSFSASTGIPPKQESEFADYPYTDSLHQSYSYEQLNHSNMIVDENNNKKNNCFTKSDYSPSSIYYKHIDTINDGRMKKHYSYSTDNYFNTNDDMNYWPYQPYNNSCCYYSESHNSCYPPLWNDSPLSTNHIHIIDDNAPFNLDPLPDSHSVTQNDTNPSTVSLSIPRSSNYYYDDQPNRYSRSSTLSYMNYNRISPSEKYSRVQQDPLSRDGTDNINLCESHDFAQTKELMHIHSGYSQ